MSFWLAQACGFVATIFIIIAVSCKKAEKILLFITLENTFLIFEYIFVHAWTGAVITTLNTIRCLVFFIYKRKKMEPSLFWLIAFEVMTVVSGIVSWQNAWSIIPIVITLVYTYGLWQDNPTIIKLTSCVSGAGWTVYNFVFRAYIGAVGESIHFIAAVVSLIVIFIRHKKSKRETEQPLDETLVQ